MIRSGIIAALLVLAVAGEAVAQPVPVQSGEHAGFTRLVARIGAGTDWDLTRDGREVHIAFSPETPAFDLTEVFERIPRDRLDTITGNDGLHLLLACDCSISLSRYQQRYLVIDISDTPVQPEPEPLPEPEPVLELPLFTERASLPAHPLVSQPGLPVPQAEPPPAPVTGFDLDEAGALLAEQMARAAAAGLVDPAPLQPLTTADPLPASTHHAPTPQPHTDPAEDGHGTDHDAPETAMPGPPPPIRAVNAYDLNQGTDPGRLLASAAGSCLPAPTRPISDWSGELEFLNGVGRLRALAYDDRGRLSDPHALELARLYLVHGFGIEATFWLQELADPPAFELAMADFLDNRTEGVFGRFADHEICPDGLLVWLFLSDPEARPLVETVADILAGFYAMPTPLRDAVGPDLARALVRAGRSGAALEVREALARGGRLSPQDMAFLDLDLPGQPAPPPEAIAPANAGSTRAETALAYRLMEAIHDHGAADPADLVAADALVLETDPALSIDGLRHAAALGYALAGNIEGSIAHLDLRGQRDAEAIGPVFADILSALMARERTAPLLLLLSSEDFGQFGHFPNPAFRRRVAEYLLDHGLPGLARDLILAGGGDHARDRELLTRAFDRLSQDLNDTAQPLSGATAPPDIPPADSPAAMAELLSESRAMRDELAELLAQTRLEEPSS